MNAVREIPLSKLVPSAANVRKTGAGVGIEELAASIGAHGLLQNLSVQPVFNRDGAATGKFAVVAGARRLAAMKLLATRKAFAKNAPVPCIVKEASNPTEISLAENFHQLPMHPADQYEAFAKLHAEQGQSVDDIAARFGLTPAVVKQRMKLGAVSPVLMQVYRNGDMNLEQLMAFTITDDHTAQERVWSELSWNKDRHMIRRLLTQGQVPAQDRRAKFVGADAYEAAGGVILRDLFDETDGGYFTDTALLDRLVLAKLEAAAADIAAEGWKWCEVKAEFPHGHAAGLRRVYPEAIPQTTEAQERFAALEAEYEALALQHDGEVSDEIAAELERLESAIDALRGQEAYRPEDVARGGAFVTLGHEGAVRIERGFVRPEDMPVVEPSSVVEADDASPGEAPDSEGEAIGSEEAEPDDKPLSDRLVEELTLHRTAALQDRLAGRPDVALAAVVHALALRTFYGVGVNPHTCLKIEAGPVAFGNGVGDGTAARAVAARHDRWAGMLPKKDSDLWAWLIAQDDATRLSLLAHCAARTVNAVRVPWTHEPKRLAQADTLAQAVGLDMADYWAPTVDLYLGRVTKARIVEAVRDGASERDAESIASLKKAEMASHAERLLAGKRWLPSLLRTLEPVAAAHSECANAEAIGRAAE